MKTIVAIALLTLSTVLRAQVGAKVDSISVPEFGGAKVLHHCMVIELQADTAKISHDDGISVVALRYLPNDLQKNVNDRKEAQAAARKKALAEAEIEGQKAGSEPTAASETKAVASSDPTPTNEGAERSSKASSNRNSAAAAQTNGAAENDPEMMSRKSHSKASSSNPNNYPIATITPPTVRRAPSVHYIPIPGPYYRPISPPITMIPQSGGPGSEDY